MIGHRALFRENDDLPLWRGPAIKKKPPLEMRNAILGNDLKQLTHVNWHFLCSFTLSHSPPIVLL